MTTPVFGLSLIDCPMRTKRETGVVMAYCPQLTRHLSPTITTIIPTTNYTRRGLTRRTTHCPLCHYPLDTPACYYHICPLLSYIPMHWTWSYQANDTVFPVPLPTQYTPPVFITCASTSLVNVLGVIAVFLFVPLSPLVRAVLIHLTPSPTRRRPSRPSTPGKIYPTRHLYEISGGMTKLT
jgi:hypothetical protein